MTSETDDEFVERMRVRGAWAPDSDVTRLFALARRGAAVQWMPASDPPDSSDDVFLHDKNEGVGVGFHVPLGWHWMSGGKSSAPTHWMPLPPPPTGEPEHE